MSDVLDALFRSDGAMGVLRAFGLNRLLTGEDDPALWAAALMRHWHAPQEPGLHLAALRFGVSRAVPASLAGAVKPARSGMQQLEVWCFERVEANRLRPVVCPQQPALSFMGALGGGAWVQDVLEVSRPSLGEPTALVYVGMTAPVNAGSGETRLWDRAADGTWTETGEIVSRWLA
jgi:hypothetical protein